MTEKLKQLEQILGIQFQEYSYKKKEQPNTYRSYGGIIRELRIRDCVLPPESLLSLSDELMKLTLTNCSIDRIADLRCLRKLEELALDQVTIQQKEAILPPDFVYTQGHWNRFSLLLKEMSIEHLADFLPIAGNSSYLELSVVQCVVANFQEINLFCGLGKLRLTGVTINRSEKDRFYPVPAERDPIHLDLHEMNLENLEPFAPVFEQVKSLTIIRCVLQTIRDIHRFVRLKDLNIDTETQIADTEVCIDPYDSFRIEECFISHGNSETKMAFDLRKLSSIAHYIKNLSFYEYVRHQADGLKLFTNLEKLEFESSTVTLRDFLPVAHQIKALKLYKSTLNKSKSLVKFTNLERIEISSWGMKGLWDLEKLLPLKHQLKELDIHEDELKKTALISQFTQLELLSLEVESAETAQAIFNMGSLKNIWLTVNDETKKTITFDLKSLHHLQELMLSCRNKVNLKGIEQLQQLRRLWLEGDFKTVDLHLLKKLEYLDVELKGRFDLHRIQVMNSLRILKLNADEYPICSLEQFPNLEKLKISVYNQPEFGIGRLEKLNVLIPEGIDLETTTCLDQLPNLEQLDLSCCRISVLQNLDKLPNLKILNLAENEIESLSGLENLKNLERLNLYENNVSDLRILNRLRQLKEVNLGCNSVDEKDVLEQLEKPEIAVFMYLPHVPFSISFGWSREHSLL